MLAHVTTHDADAKAALLEQYKDKPRFLVLVSAFTAEIQAIEDALWAFYVQRQIQSSPPPTGDLLAKLGSIVGQSSLGLSDAVYLNMVLARIAVTNTNGQKNDIITVMHALYFGPSGSGQVAVFTVAPASVHVEPLGTVPFSPYIINAQFLQPTVGGGISIAYVFSPAARGSTLVLGSVYATGFAAGPVPTNLGLLAGQILGTVYFAGFSAGPPPTNTGGAIMPGVIGS